jgi:GxxExxY protein
VELATRGLRFERQRPLRLEYKGEIVDCAYRLDVVVNDRILIDFKAVERLLSIHEAQVVTYLKLARLPVGLLVNFDAMTLKHATRRLTPNPPNFRSSDLPVQSLTRSE